MLRADPAARTRGISAPILIAYGLAAMAVMFWSGNWVMARAVRADISPLELNFWRWAIATLVLLPFAWRQARRDWAIARAHWAIVLALGASGAAVFHSMIYIGLRTTEAVNALLLNASAPVIIILIAWIMFRDTITGRQMAGICLSMLGAVVLVSRGDPSALSSLRFNWGDQWVLAALFVWGIYSNLLQRRPARMGGLSLLFYISVVGAVLMAPGYVWDLWRNGPMDLNLTNLASAGYTGVFASIAAFLCYNAAVARIGPVVVSFFLHLMPVFGGAMAILFLGETVHPYHFLGFAVVLSGIFISTARASSAQG